MAKNCKHTVPCGCKDVPLTTGAPCGDGIECEGNPCAENFCAECILWCGPDLPDLGIVSGTPLSDIIQIMSIMVAREAAGEAYKGCIDSTTDQCKSVIFNVNPVVTSTSIALSWTLPTGVTPQGLILIYEQVDTGASGKVTLDAAAVAATIDNLNSDKEYKIYIITECAEEVCNSAVMQIKTLA